jgi:predicted nucleotidyltransferase
MKTLFITNVGSHMWNMQTPESDLDLMLVYQEDTKHILEGKPIHVTKPDKSFVNGTDGILVDQKEQEIGHLVNKLIDGNVNAIWTVCTPIIVHDNHYLQELRTIVEHNLSKASYASINGMAMSLLKDHTKRAGVMPEGKALRTAWRTCVFGQSLLLEGKIKFKPMFEDVTVEDVEWIIKSLKYIYESASSLPDKPDEKPFRDFLFKLRIDNLVGS